MRPKGAYLTLAVLIVYADISEAERLGGTPAKGTGR